MSSRLYCLSAEFVGKTDLLEAARRARAAGYRRLEAYTPFPIEELPEVLGRKRSIVPLMTLLGGTIWGLGGYFMEWFSMGIGYPINVGGRPYNSWPAFVPVTFEMTILGASLSALASMLILNRLPRLHHPVFNAPNFERASQDRFFLCIEADDPIFDAAKTRAFLLELHPLSVGEASL